MDLGLKGRSVLVTGGSKGIGLACARAFLAEGAKVDSDRLRDSRQSRRPRRNSRRHDRLCPFADLTLSEDAMTNGAQGRGRARAWSDRHPGEFRRRGEALCAGRIECAGLARGHGRQVLHLHPRDGRSAAFHESARPRHRGQRDRHRRQDCHPHPSPRRRGQFGADARLGGARARLWQVRRADQRDPGAPFSFPLRPATSSHNWKKSANSSASPHRFRRIWK